ncbi:MAG TPA: S26 family signal peptidase, partial [Acidimicrobiia bacterium]|nr:S26 family signal peptidase [Acidimicrobiia bacterium]
MRLITKQLTAAAVLAVAAVAVGVRAVRRVTIEGDSMRPTLEPGDRLVLLPARTAHRGDLVGVADPAGTGRLLVKRVAAAPGETAVTADGARVAAGAGYIVVGDNPSASTDSRHFGPVEPGRIRG